MLQDESRQRSSDQKAILSHLRSFAFLPRRQGIMAANDEADMAESVPKNDEQNIVGQRMSFQSNADYRIGSTIFPMNRIVPEWCSRITKMKGRSTAWINLSDGPILVTPIPTDVTAAALVPSSSTCTNVLHYLADEEPAAFRRSSQSAVPGLNAIDIPIMMSISFSVFYSSLNFGSIDISFLVLFIRPIQVFHCCCVN